MSCVVVHSPGSVSDKRGSHERDDGAGDGVGVRRVLETEGRGGWEVALADGEGLARREGLASSMWIGWSVYQGLPFLGEYTRKPTQDR